MCLPSTIEPSSLPAASHLGQSSFLSFWPVSTNLGSAVGTRGGAAGRAAGRGSSGKREEGKRAEVMGSVLCCDLFQSVCLMRLQRASRQHAHNHDSPVAELEEALFDPFIPPQGSLQDPHTFERGRDSHQERWCVDIQIQRHQAFLLPVLCLISLRMRVCPCMHLLKTLNLGGTSVVPGSGMLSISHVLCPQNLKF